MDDLDYFVEWGEKAWHDFVKRSVNDYIGTGLDGMNVLEVGARCGKMACFFSLLGATVTAIDKNSCFLTIAEKEAEKWKVKDRITFAYAYGADSLGGLPDGRFDVLFTKSVLYSIRIQDFGPFLEKLLPKLRSGAKLVLIENMEGNLLYKLARPILYAARIRKWKSTSFFTEDHINTMQKYFKVERIERTSYPPVCCIWARKT